MSEASGELSIKTESDIVVARRSVREAATRFGFGQTDVTRIVTATSEIARNAFKYAGGGVMRWRFMQINGRAGIEICFADCGPGIQDVELALRPGYSTTRSLGMGLPGAKRLMDDLDIQSAVGKGTTVTLKKWRRS
jgi:serine/threonine-protein kinase RsbT